MRQFSSPLIKVMIIIEYLHVLVVDQDTLSFFLGLLGHSNNYYGRSWQIGHFWVHLGLHFKARLSAKSLLWKSVFIHIEIRTNYHNKSFALRLALKERLRGTRKWPIMHFVYVWTWLSGIVIVLEVCGHYCTFILINIKADYAKEHLK